MSLMRELNLQHGIPEHVRRLDKTHRPINDPEELLVTGPSFSEPAWLEENPYKRKGKPYYYDGGLMVMNAAQFIDQAPFFMASTPRLSWGNRQGRPERG